MGGLTPQRSLQNLSLVHLEAKMSEYCDSLTHFTTIPNLLQFILWGTSMSVTDFGPICLADVEIFHWMNENVFFLVPLNEKTDIYQSQYKSSSWDKECLYQILDQTQ